MNIQCYACSAAIMYTQNIDIGTCVNYSFPKLIYKLYVCYSCWTIKEKMNNACPLCCSVCCHKFSAGRYCIEPHNKPYNLEEVIHRPILLSIFTEGLTNHKALTEKVNTKFKRPLVHQLAGNSCCTINNSLPCVRHFKRVLYITKELNMLLTFNIVLRASVSQYNFRTKKHSMP